MSDAEIIPYFFGASNALNFIAIIIALIMFTYTRKKFPDTDKPYHKRKQRHAEIFTKLILLLFLCTLAFGNILFILKLEKAFLTLSTTQSILSITASIFFTKTILKRRTE